jgi:threonine/homoserine efflux transporter RhtA
MSRLRLIAMVALAVVGLALLVIGPMDDRSINWVNVVLAAACFAGAIYLRPLKTK